MTVRAELITAKNAKEDVHDPSACAQGLKRECEMRVRAVGESAEEELRRSVAAVRAEMTSAQTDAASHKRAVEAAQAELLVSLHLILIFL